MSTNKNLEDELEEVKKRLWALSRDLNPTNYTQTIQTMVSGAVSTAASSLQTTLSQSITTQIQQEQSALSQTLSGQVSQAESNLSASLSSAFDDLAAQLADDIQNQISSISGSFPYVKLSSPITNTSTSSGTTTLSIENIIGADYVSGAVYELFGYVLAYQTDTRYVYLFSDLWGDESTYYIINTTSNSRVGSTAFSIPAASYVKFKKNNSVGEFKLRIYGYRRIR